MVHTSSFRTFNFLQRMCELYRQAVGEEIYRQILSEARYGEFANEDERWLYILSRLIEQDINDSIVIE